MPTYKLFSRQTYNFLFVYKKALLTLLLLPIFLDVKAQDPAQRITVEQPMMSVKAAISAIEEQTGYRVVYFERLGQERIINLRKRVLTTTELLDLIVENSGGFIYEFGDNAIKIYKPERVESAPESRKVARVSRQSIFGYVKDVGGRASIEGAVIKLSGAAQRHSTTDAIGAYSFDDIPEGTYSISVSKAGYVSQELKHTIRPEENLRLMFILNPVSEKVNRRWDSRFIYPTYTTSTIGEFISANTLKPYQEQRLPRFAIKTNLFYDALLAPSLGVEVRMGKHLTLDIPVVYKPFTIDKEGVRETRLFSVQPEVRFWQDPFNRHFIGAHLIYAQYNLGGFKPPFGLYPDLNEYRHAGHFYGVGFSYGYHAFLSKSFSFEFTLGVGYGYADYKRYTCRDCSKYVDKGYKHYFGPTKLGVSLVYMLK